MAQPSIWIVLFYSSMDIPFSYNTAQTIQLLSFIAEFALFLIIIIYLTNNLFVHYNYSNNANYACVLHVIHINKQMETLKNSFPGANHYK